MSNKKQPRINTIILSVIVIVLVSYGAIYIPVSRYWQSVSSHLEKYERRLQRNTRIIEQVSTIRDEYGHMKDSIVMSPGATEYEVSARFLKELEKMIQGQGVSIVDLHVLPIIKREDGQQFMIQTELETTVDPLINLLYTVAVTDDLIMIEEMSIERKNAQSQQLVIRAVFAKVQIVP